MITDQKIEKLEKSAVKLTLTVKKEEAKKEYDALLNKYAKDAHIKGFRKGKAPRAILEQKFGEGITHEASMNLMENSLKKVFEDIDEKPLHYCTPELQEEAVIELGKDFTFSVKYDVFPEVTVKKYKNLEIEAPEVKVNKKDIDAELEKLQEQNSIVKEKADGTATKDSIVTINYIEMDDEDKEIESTKREDFVFTVGTGYNLYELDEDVTGMKKDEEKVITKDFPEDHTNKDLAGKTKKIKVKITAVKEKELPEMDDELAQDISEKYKTLKDLKDDLTNKLQTEAERQVRIMKVDALMEKIMEQTEIDLPQSMINAELENNWRNFMYQSRMQEEQLLKILEMQQKSKQDMLDEWLPNAEKNLKHQLIVNKLVEDEKVDTTDEEFENEIKKQAEQREMSLEDAKKYVEDNKLTEMVKNDIRNKKLFDLVLDSTTIKKGKKLSYMDLTQKNQ